MQQPQGYGAQPGYPPQQQAYAAAPQSNPIGPSAYGMGVPNVNLPNVSIPLRKGMPTAVAFVMAVLAIVVALGVDAVFMQFDIPEKLPGFGGYLWWASTAIAFGGFGYLATAYTKASVGLVRGVLIGATILYAVGDLGLSLVLDNVDMQTAIIVGGESLGIGLFMGFGGIFRGASKRDDD
jgi:hypothetical protein